MKVSWCNNLDQCYDLALLSWHKPLALAFGIPSINRYLSHLLSIESTSLTKSYSSAFQGFVFINNKNKINFSSKILLMLFHFIEPVAKMTTLGLLGPHPRFYLPSYSPLSYLKAMSHLPPHAKCLSAFFRPERITAEGDVQADSNNL